MANAPVDTVQCSVEWSSDLDSLITSGIDGIYQGTEQAHGVWPSA